MAGCRLKMSRESYPIDNGHVEMLRWLLGLGIDPNETDDFGGSALIHAAEAGSTDCVKLLFGRGANLHYSRHSESAIKAASSLAIVRILVEAGRISSTSSVAWATPESDDSARRPFIASISTRWP